MLGLALEWVEGRGQAAAPAAQSAAPMERPRIVSVLLATNPNLGPITSERIADAVLRCSREQGLPAELVLAVLLVESSARPAVRSPKGAIGLMQVMPHMFEELSLPGNVAHIESAGPDTSKPGPARMGSSITWTGCRRSRRLPASPG